MSRVLAGLHAALLLAAIAALLSAMWLAQVAAVTVRELGAQSTTALAQLTADAHQTLGAADAAARNASRLTDDQRRILNVSSASVARLIQHTDAALNCDTVGGHLGHGTAAIDCRELGLLVQASALVGAGDARLGKFSDALDHALGGLEQSTTDAHTLLTNPDIPRILAGLAEASDHFDGTTVHLEAMSQAGQQAMADLAGAIHDLRNPAKPARWIRALGLMLSILRAGGQSAPLFK